MSVEAIFAIPVTPFPPGDDAHLIPAVVIGALKRKEKGPNRGKFESYQATSLSIHSTTEVLEATLPS